MKFSLDGVQTGCIYMIHRKGFRMAKIAIAGFQHETNSFSPIPTTLEDFTSGGLSTPGILRGEELFYFGSRPMNNATSGFLHSASALGMEPVPLVWMEAEPSANMSAETFDFLMQILETALKEMLPVDGLYLDLHGAMIFGEGQDGEAEILRRLRPLTGGIPVVVSLDLHGNIDPASFELADAMISCRTYPHVDFYETGERCALMMKHLLEGKSTCKAMRQLPFLIPTSSQKTTSGPLTDVYAQLDSLESCGEVRSASILPGFPPGDIESSGPSVLVYASSQHAAESAADALSTELLRREPEFTSRLTSLDAALDQAAEWITRSDKPVILADVQDNPGGGSGSDSVWILEGLLQRGLRDAGIALVYDPAAAEAAHIAGEGNTITIGLGGKMLPGHTPHSATYRVAGLFDGEFEATGPMAKGMILDLGRLALLEIDGIHISVSSTRIQAADQAVFTLFGLDPSKLKILVLKSFIHYRAAFEGIAGKIIEVETPGAEFDNPAGMPYRHLRKGIRLGGNGPVWAP